MAHNPCIEQLTLPHNLKHTSIISRKQRNFNSHWGFTNAMENENVNQEIDTSSVPLNVHCPSKVVVFPSRRVSILNSVLMHKRSNPYQLTLAETDEVFNSLKLNCQTNRNISADFNIPEKDWHFDFSAKLYKDNIPNNLLRLKSKRLTSF